MEIEVKVHAQSGRNEVVEKTASSFVVYTTKTPQKGEANKSVVRLLAKYFHVAQSHVLILRGEKSKKKLVQIDF